MNHNNRIQTYARWGGILYLLIIVLGGTSQIFLRGPLIEASNASMTAANIASSSLVWRLSVAGDILMHALDIPLMVILYRMLSPVNRDLAAVGVLFNVVQTCVLVANKMTLLVPTILLGRANYSDVVGLDELQEQVLLMTEFHDFGFGLGLTFFGLACLIYGRLIYQSGYLPKPIGCMVAVAGVSYLINSLTLILFPEYSGTVVAVLVLSLIGELSFALWLLIKGVDVSCWEKRTRTNVSQSA